MAMLLPVVTAIVTAWVIVTLLVPPISRICHVAGWLDKPGPRKVHARPTPRLGGVAVFAGLWGALAITALVFPASMQEFDGHTAPIFLSALLILGVGIWDDIRPLSGFIKLGAQVVAGMPLWFGGIGFTQLWIPFWGAVELGWLALPVSAFWFLILVNAVNMIDGVDGLATATTGVAAVTLIWLSWTLHLSPILAASGALLGALIGFWRYNGSPASIFLGDSGSLTLGHFFAVVALLAPIKRLTALAYFLPLLALMLPLAESALSVFRRSVAGIHPFQGDLGHVHHLLLKRGWSENQVVAAYSITSAVFGLFCVGYRYFNRRWLTLGLAFFVLLLGVTLAIILRSNVPGPDARSGRPAREE
ncbi:MAG: MraY family glycosyltransferase [Candidatus Zixiibacteriota bacterium]